MVRLTLACLMLIAFGAFFGAFGQLYEKLPKLIASPVVAETLERLGRKPAISARLLADFANSKLLSGGYEFEVDPCDIKSTETTLKYPGDEGGVFHIYEMTDATGNARSFLAREPGDAPCGCWLHLPVVSITEKRMVLVSDKGTIEVERPNDLLVESVELVDRTLDKSLGTWVVPHGGPPDGISVDGKNLYIEIEKTGLFLEIARNGALRFVPGGSVAIITKFTDLKKFPKDPQNDYLGFRRFSNGRKTFTVKFSHVCT